MEFRFKFGTEFHTLQYLQTTDDVIHSAAFDDGTSSATFLNRSLSVGIGALLARIAELEAECKRFHDSDDLIRKKLTSAGVALYGTDGQHDLSITDGIDQIIEERREALNEVKRCWGWLSNACSISASLHLGGRPPAVVAMLAERRKESNE